jgi:hypothetical protein
MMWIGTLGSPVRSRMIGMLAATSSWAGISPPTWNV